MNFLEYEFLDTALANEAGNRLREIGLLQETRAARVVEHVRKFVRHGVPARGHLAAPEFPEGRWRIYAVPRPADLEILPDVLLLIRADHDSLTLEIIALFEDYPSSEGKPWEQICAFARGSLP